MRFILALKEQIWKEGINLAYQTEETFLELAVFWRGRVHDLLLLQHFLDLLDTGVDLRLVGQNRNIAVSRSPLCVRRFYDLKLDPECLQQRLNLLSFFSDRLAV